MIVVKNNIIPVKPYNAMALWPFIFVRKGTKVTEKLLIHEHIHGRQQLEMLIIPFLLWYVVEFVVRTLLGKGNAYRNICFEREAYQNENNMEYIEHRHRWAFLRYLANDFVNSYSKS